MALASLTDLKAYIGKSDTTDDTLLSRLLSASSDFFESQCGRTIGTGSYSENRNGDGSTSIAPRHWPVVGVSSVAVDGIPMAQATGSTDPGWCVSEGLVRLRSTGSFTVGTNNVNLVYTAGFDPIPGDVQQAVIELAALKYGDRKHIGKQGESLAGSSVSYLPSMIPMSVQAVISSYRRIFS